MTGRDFLQGKWMGHPLHAAVVHVPMGLWPAAFLFDLLNLAGVSPEFLGLVSFLAILLGLLAVLLAVPTGWMDWMEIKREKPAWKLGLAHMIINGLASLVWLVNLIVRIPGLGEAERVTGTAVGLSAFGFVFLAIGAWLGGRMVFDQGTSIARSSKEKLRKAAEEGGANLPD